MSNSLYIEVTSANRDRKRDKYQSSFIVDCSISRQQHSGLYARDPVYYSTISYFPGSIYTIDSTTFGLIPNATQTLSSTSSFYEGKTLQVETSAGIEYRTITDYVIGDQQIVNTKVSDTVGFDPLYNFSSALNNNTFSYVWSDGVTYNVVIPDGIYGIIDLNAFLQYTMIQNNHYLIDNNNEFVFYMEMVLNITALKVQLNCFPVPTSLPSGWSEPSGWGGYPLTATTPMLFVNNALFADMIGFVNNTYYPSAPQATVYSVISTSTAYILSTVSITQTSIPIDSSCDINNFFNGWTCTFTNTKDQRLQNISRVVKYYQGANKTIYFDRPIDIPIVSGDTIQLTSPSHVVTIDIPFNGSIPTLEQITLINSIPFTIRTYSPLYRGDIVSGTTRQFELDPAIGSAQINGDLLQFTSYPIIASGTFNSATMTDSTFTFVSAFVTNHLKGMAVRTASGNEYSIISNDAVTNIITIEYEWGVDVSVLNGTTFDIVYPHYIHRIVKSYNPTTFSGEVTDIFSYVSGNGSIVPYTVSSNDSIEILKFKEDNYHELDLPESSISNQQAVCHEIQLISLTLPNVPLKTGYGRTISSYPYVYVEFSSVTQGTSAYEFNSNNSHVNKNTMFRASMIYNFQPEQSTFVTLDGHNMKQILKFKPNDAFRFSVYLPNGELFITEEEDLYSPYEPNPLLQISACFGIRKYLIG